MNDTTRWCQEVILHVGNQSLVESLVTLSLSALDFVYAEEVDFRLAETVMLANALPDPSQTRRLLNYVVTQEGRGKLRYQAQHLLEDSILLSGCLGVLNSVGITYEASIGNGGFAPGGGRINVRCKLVVQTQMVVNIRLPVGKGSDSLSFLKYPLFGRTKGSGCHCVSMLVVTEVGVWAGEDGPTESGT